MLRQLLLALLFVAYAFAIVRLADVGLIGIHPRFATNLCRYFPAARFCALPSSAPPPPTGP